MPHRVVTASTNAAHAPRGAEALAVLLLATVCIALAVVILTAARSDRPDRVAGSKPSGTDRWQGRPILGGLVVATAYAIPIIAAVTASSIVSRFLARPSGWGPTLLTYGF